MCIRLRETIERLFPEQLAVRQADSARQAAATAAVGAAAEPPPAATFAQFAQAIRQQQALLVSEPHRITGG